MKSERHTGQQCARRARVALALLFTVLFSIMISHAVANAQTRPQRIVSMNLCTDELLMRLVDPSRIASVTYLSQQSVNAPLGLDSIASKLKINHGLAEEILMQKPDLVLAPIGGNFTMDPTDAAYAMREMIKPKFAVPMHYGANPLAKGTAEEFRKAMDGASTRVFYMKPGEKIEF